MSVNEKVLKALQELKARADAGDVKAKFELKRAVKAIKQQVVNQRAQQAKKRREEQLVGLVQSGALDHLLIGSGDKDGDVEMDGDEGGEEVVGWNPKSIEEGTYDELEQANDLMRAEPTADDLSHKARLKSLKHEALNQAAPFVRSTPVSILNGNIGQQAKVWTGTGLASDQPTTQQVALWQGDDAEAGPVTVTLSPVFAPTARDFNAVPIVPALLRPFAIIRYGTRGMSVAFETDICAGLEFVVGCSNISVQVGLEDSVGPIGSLDLAGMLSFGPGAIHSPTAITRSRYVPPSAGPATTVPVPLFARSVSLWRSRTEHMLLFFVDSQGVAKYDRELIAGAVCDPIPISGEIVEVVVVENGGAAYAAQTLIFELGL